MHELVSECSSCCKEYDTEKKRSKLTNVACIMPSGEIFDADGVTADVMKSKFEAN